jgi:hypothetical protein
MTTKKDLVIIAEELHEACEYVCSFKSEGFDNQKRIAGFNSGLDAIMCALVKINPRFDQAKFLTAVWAHRKDDIL